MKAIFKYIAVIFAVAVSMTSCREDYDIPSTGAPDHAETLAVGTYVGEWSQTNVSTGEVKTAPGSITFGVAKDENSNDMPNVSSMTVVCDGIDLGVNSDTSVCNITRQNSGYLTYWSSTKANPFGMTFTGKISPENVATMDYTKIVRTGRKEVEYSYSFKGSKQ